MAQEKMNPTVETVQQAVKVSDLLMYKVCEPVKEQIDKIKLCTPNVSIPFDVCKPDQLCRPYSMNCLPAMCIPSCKPYNYCIPKMSLCEPQIPEMCTPSAGTTIDPDEIVISPEIIRQKLLASDFEQLQADVARLKAEIADLRNR